MKLKDYLESLNEKIKLDPSILELDLYYASDDEGNSFNRVNFDPSVMYQHKHYLEEIRSELDEDEDHSEYTKVFVIN